MNANPLGGLSRRDVLRLTAAGVTGVSLSGWLGVLAGRAAEAKGRHKSCILLWMDGGPSHKDTFDLKPDSKGAGDFKPIPTRMNTTPKIVAIVFAMTQFFLPGKKGWTNGGAATRPNGQGGPAFVNRHSS